MKVGLFSEARSQAVHFQQNERNKVKIVVEPKFKDDQGVVHSMIVEIEDGTKWESREDFHYVVNLPVGQGFCVGYFEDGKLTYLEYGAIMNHTIGEKKQDWTRN